MTNSSHVVLPTLDAEEISVGPFVHVIENCESPWMYVREYFVGYIVSYRWALRFVECAICVDVLEQQDKEQFAKIGLLIHIFRY